MAGMCGNPGANVSLQVDAHGNDNVGVKDGWKRNFFDRIKMVFGYGVPQFS